MILPRLFKLLKFYSTSPGSPIFPKGSFFQVLQVLSKQCKKDFLRLRSGTYFLCKCSSFHIQSNFPVTKLHKLNINLKEPSTFFFIKLHLNKKQNIETS